MRVAGDDDVAQIGAPPEHVREEREPLGRGHQHAHVAVAQDVGDLLGLEQRIDRHEHAAGRRGAERRDHRLEALVEIDRDAVRAGEAEGEEAGAECGDPLLKRGVVERLAAVNHCGRLGLP